MQQPKKQCSKCHEWVPYSDFCRNRTRKDGLDPRCKKCHREYWKKIRSSEKVRNRYLRRKYGIAPLQYNRMLAEQHGVCASCGMPERRIDWQTKTVKPLAVDHDHQTGDVRALLCEACNQALGIMNEDPEHIRALANYAEWCQTREPNTRIIQLSMIESDQLQQRPETAGRAGV